MPDPILVRSPGRKSEGAWRMSGSPPPEQGEGCLRGSVKSPVWLFGEGDVGYFAVEVGDVAGVAAFLVVGLVGPDSAEQAGADVEVAAAGGDGSAEGLG